jgi:hypothetical protein
VLMGGLRHHAHQALSALSKIDPGLAGQRTAENLRDEITVLTGTSRTLIKVFARTSAAVASVPAAELEFAGIALHADRKTVDKVLDKLSVHP